MCGGQPFSFTKYMIHQIMRGKANVKMVKEGEEYKIYDDFELECEYKDGQIDVRVLDSKGKVVATFGRYRFEHGDTVHFKKLIPYLTIELRELSGKQYA